MQFYKVAPIRLEGAALLGTPCIAVTECPYFPPALTACFMISSLRGKIPYTMPLTFPPNCCTNPRKWRCLRTVALLATSVPGSAAPRLTSDCHISDKDVPSHVIQDTIIALTCLSQSRSRINYIYISFISLVCLHLSTGIDLSQINIVGKMR
jgi:hypothetical protein